MKYADRVAADIRLLLCRLLTNAGEYRANSSILHGLLRDYGYSVSRDQLQAELDWLAEANVIDIESLDVPGLRIATLTQRGVDVATGASAVAGIARPSPGR